MLFFYYFMKMSGEQKNECAPTGSRKHRSHKFAVVETKMAVPRHSRIDESLLRISWAHTCKEEQESLEIHLL